jgi:hypothetical protein
MQRALLQWKRPEKRQLVLEALRETGREDLIGYGKHYLVPPARYPAARNTKGKTKAAPEKKAGKKPAGNKTAVRKTVPNKKTQFDKKGRK